MPTETITYPKEPIVDVAQSPWMSKEEAAQYLGVSGHTLNRYVRDGKLLRFKLAGGQTVRFKRVDIEGLLVPDVDREVETPLT